MTSTIRYAGDLRCVATHNQSGSTIETDAPTDNKGKGEKFSPTDTVCVALATCILTTMAIKTEGLGIDLTGSVAEVTKHMLSEPRRIGKIDVVLSIPVSTDDKTRTILEKIGHTCPVAKSLHPDLILNISYNWLSN